jgi:hypothetical protein
LEGVLSHTVHPCVDFTSTGDCGNSLVDLLKPRDCSGGGDLECEFCR